MNDMIKIIIGLVCVIFANILLGAKLADLKNEFSWSKLWAGLFKSVCIVIAVCLMYVCSYYNPNIMVANINGINVNLITGMKAIFIAGIALYGFQDLNKLQKLLKTKVDIQEPKEDGVTHIERDDING